VAWCVNSQLIVAVVVVVVVFRRRYRRPSLVVVADTGSSRLGGEWERKFTKLLKRLIVGRVHGRVYDCFQTLCIDAVLS